TNFRPSLPRPESRLRFTIRCLSICRTPTPHWATSGETFPRQKKLPRRSCLCQCIRTFQFLNRNAWSKKSSRTHVFAGSRTTIVGAPTQTVPLAVLLLDRVPSGHGTTFENRHRLRPHPIHFCNHGENQACGSRSSCKRNDLDRLGEFPS